VLDPALDAIALDPQHAELNLTVRQQDAIVHPDIVGQRFVVDGDGALVAGVARNHVDHVPAVEHRGADLGRANLGSAQILENGDGLAPRRALAPHDLQHFSVIVVAAVREVEPGDVHACFDEAADTFSGFDGGTNGADDFGAASNHGSSTGLLRSVSQGWPLGRSGSALTSMPHGAPPRIASAVRKVFLALGFSSNSGLDRPHAGW
jgi:hypothetical protein